MKIAMKGYSTPRTYDYEAVFYFIVEFKRMHDGNSPTIREIQKHFGIKSSNTARNILLALEKQGKIIRQGPSKRICVAGGSWLMSGEG